MPKRTSPPSNETPDRSPAGSGARRRVGDPETRRRVIAAAALEVFSTVGFAAARLEDVAARAGVAKGTVYLYFEHKEALLEHLIRSAAAPVLDQAEQLVLIDAPFEQVLRGFYRLASEQVLKTERRLVIRLILTEGRRFPSIAEFYHREVIARGIGIMRKAAQAAVARGETRYRPFVEFPHLVIAPVVFAITWDGLFSPIEELDFEKLLEAQLALVIPQEKSK